MINESLSDQRNYRKLIEEMRDVCDDQLRHILNTKADYLNWDGLQNIMKDEIDKLIQLLKKRR